MGRQHQVFISSQMTRGILGPERAAVREVIRKFPHFQPWDWENNSCAGEHTPLEQCLEEVERSLALVLIVSQTLTEHTRMEYEKATNAGILRFIFFKKGRQKGAAYEFRKWLSQAGSPSWLEYKNLSELISIVHRSLKEHCYEAELAYRPSIGTQANIHEVEV